MLNICNAEEGGEQVTMRVRVFMGGIVFYAYNEVVGVRGGWVVFYEYADSIGMFYSSANLLVEYVLFY